MVRDLRVGRNGSQRNPFPIDVWLTVEKTKMMTIKTVKVTKKTVVKTTASGFFC